MSLHADFPLLRSDEIMSAKKMDGTVREIIQVLERCSKLETTFSDEERKDNEELLHRVDGVVMNIISRVLQVDNALDAREKEGHEAMLLLFRKRLLTPDNLEMLLRMVDSDIQAGKGRCIAFGILMRLVHGVDFIWSLKMKDGSYFATSYIVACSKALENETNEDCNNHHTERSCHCAFAATIYLDMAMRMTKDAPVKVIKRVHSFNWAQILSKTKTKSKANGTDRDRYQWFIGLHDFCMDVFKVNADHSLAREFLQKLELCHDFFRGALDHLVRLTRSLPSVPKEEIGELLLHLELIRRVLRKYSTTLTPPPNDPRTDILVRLAHQTLTEARPTVIAALRDPTVDQKGFVTQDYDELLLHTDPRQWARLKTISKLQRKQRFEAGLSEHKTNHKASRQGATKFVKEKAEQHFGKDEMCANCHMLESKMQQGETLSKCGWCKQVTYCSRECQKQHWNKAHKKECAGRKK
jgi:hypothetical protein